MKCKHYDDGICNVLGEKVIVSCQTIKNDCPDICKDYVLVNDGNKFQKKPNKKRYYNMKKDVKSKEKE